MHQPLHGKQDATAVQPGSAKKFAIISLVAFAMVITGSVIGATAPSCQQPQFPNPLDPYGNYGFYYVQYPDYCWSSYIFTPIFGGLLIISLTLTFAALSQMSKIAPIHASREHYRCLIIWAIIITCLALPLVIDLASFSISGTIGGWYQCPMYSPCVGETQFNAWLSDLRNRSQGHRIVHAICSWMFVPFVIFAIVVQSRIKYWCCLRCKSDCTHCVSSSNGCDTCLCCLFAPGEVPGQMPYYPYEGQVVPVGKPLVAGQTEDGDESGDGQLKNEVESWLMNELLLPQYVDAFTRNGFDRMESVVLGIRDEHDLKDICPDILKGHAVLILQSVNQKRFGPRGRANYGSAIAGPPNYVDTAPSYPRFGRPGNGAFEGQY